MTTSNNHKRLRRLERIWIPDAVYFVTTCTHSRKAILDTIAAHNVLREEWASASDRHGWLIGRYVVMPDHVHFFCAEHHGGAKRLLASFMNKWKEWTSKRLSTSCGLRQPIWQETFFDRVLRRDESHAEKWSYVRDNPVRAGFVDHWSEWLWQGYIDFDEPRGY